MAEAQEVAEFVGEDRFQIVGLRIRAQSAGSRKHHSRVARVEVKVSVQNLSHLG